MVLGTARRLQSDRWTPLRSMTGAWAVVCDEAAAEERPPPQLVRSGGAIIVRLSNFAMLCRLQAGCPTP